jgi:Tripartite tricarboxylate transporter TctB family
MTDTNTDSDAGARRAARADICAGGTFVALGGGFAIGALQYDLGTAFQMGPGYVPLTLGCVLAGLGALILGHGVLVALGYRTVELETRDFEDEQGPVPWRRGALLVAAVVVFGLMIDGLGIGVVTFVTTFLAALSGHRNSPLKALVIAAGLTVLCLVIFVALLQLELPLLGEWLGG